jgi:hypothetical protein
MSAMGIALDVQRVLQGRPEGECDGAAEINAVCLEHGRAASVCPRGGVEHMARGRGLVSRCECEEDGSRKADRGGAGPPRREGICGRGWEVAG